MNNIDFVITYVNANDQKWLDKKNQSIIDHKDCDFDDVRYRDWETLKYLFRSIEKNASFVNNVFFVTDHQVPDWLNCKNSRLKIVFHEDYIPKEYLPTFNSNTIEINLHRIKELSNNFVLFNDDMFVINKTSKTDFFIDGKPCDSAIMNPIVITAENNFYDVLANNTKIINKYFNKNNVIKESFNNWFSLKYKKLLFKNILLSPWNYFLGFENFHIPYSINKSTIEELWRKEEESMKATSSSTFRNNKTNINQWLFRYWQLSSNNFCPRSTSFGEYYEYPLTEMELEKALFNKTAKVICLNDVDNNFDFKIEKEKTLKAFNKKFPEKSSFEK